MSTSRAWRALVCLTSTTMALLAACGPEIPDGLLEEFRGMASQRAGEARQRETIVVEGLDGWLFFGPELRHVSVGRFWGEEATAVSQARDPAADPLPAILDFQRQLAALGVELLVVPVPPKSIIYPEKVSSSVDVPVPIPRLDPDHQTFYALLREAGVDVLDLTETFIDGRFHPEGTVYCRQDTHWSGVGCMLAAQTIAPLVRERAWFSDLDTMAFAPRWFSSAITGDLLAALDTPAVTREELRLRGIASTTGGRATEIPSDPHSPIVLLGDSHALVFNDGDDMHATGAGLADQLAFELGIPMDLIAVRGSGATSARVNLLRRAQRDDAFWSRKRLVIWCFSSREFTEGDGWALVPIVPD